VCENEDVSHLLALNQRGASMPTRAIRMEGVEEANEGGRGLVRVDKRLGNVEEMSP